MSSAGDIWGEFDKLSPESAEEVMKIVAGFHYRDGKKNWDDSLGTIDITPKQLNDALAYFIKKGR